MLNALDKKKLILFGLLVYAVLLIVSLYSDVFSSRSDTTHLVDTNITLQLLQRAKENEIQLEAVYELTAIVLHWKRLSRVQILVQQYIKSKLIKEIIIWNNNPQINLTLGHLQVNSESLIYIRIINSKENLKDEAKYRACVEARTLTCFYADDDWNVSGYMRSLIASFRSDPYGLHSATNIVTYYNNMLWTFMDPRIDLHTGFSWIGCGSVFLRAYAQRHLQLLAVYLKDNPELFALSDIFFSIWLNDIPSQMVVNLNGLPGNVNETDFPFSSTNNFYQLQDASAVLAIRKLEYALRLNPATTNVNFPRQRFRRFPYCVRSPSSTDDFVFYSNVLPIDIENIPFDISFDADRATYKNVPSGSNYTHFSTHSTLHAVDNDEKTCWTPNRSIKKGDFFAIDFLHIRTDIVFSITIGHTQQVQNSLNIRLSFDGIEWILYRSLKGIDFRGIQLPTDNYQQLTIDSSQFSSPLQSFRYIAFNSMYEFNVTFQVCDIRIITMSSDNTK